MDDKSNIKFQERGASIMFAILILTFVLALALGTSIIIINQVKVMRDVGYSVVSFFAADAGVEVILYEDKLCRPPNCATTSPPVICTNDCTGLEDYSTSTVFSNGAGYDIDFYNNATTSIIKSTGNYKGTKRAIEVGY